MIKIKDLQQFEKEIKKDNKFCLLFGRDKSPTCLVMKTVLNEIGRKRDYKCLYLDMSIQQFHKLVLEYDVGPLPKFVFLSDDEIMYEGIGTEPKRSIEKRLKALEA